MNRLTPRRIFSPSPPSLGSPLTSQSIFDFDTLRYFQVRGEGLDVKPGFHPLQPVIPSFSPACLALILLPVENTPGKRELNSRREREATESEICADDHSGNTSVKNEIIYIDNKKPETEVFSAGTDEKIQIGTGRDWLEDGHSGLTCERLRIRN